MARIVANLNGGDETTPDNELIFKIYGDADNYTTAIETTGNAINDANVSVAGGVVTILNVDVTGQGNIKLTSIDAIGNESSQSVAFVVPPSFQTFYVRPSTTAGTYGTEDGSTYANAWNGFANVDQTQLTGGNVLAICGTHNETYTVSQNDYTIIGNDINEAGIIDSQNTITVGLDVTNFTDIIINDISIINATTSNINVAGTSSGTTNNVTLTGSGNQGMQHYGTSQWTHNNITASNNTDDGVSTHDDAVVIVNNGTFESNSEGCASVNNSTLTINYSSFSLNGEDVTNQSTGSVTINNCTITSDIKSGFTGIITTTNVNNSTVQNIGNNVSSVNTNVNIDNTIVNGIINPLNDTSNYIVTNSLILSEMSFNNISLSDCYYKPQTTASSTGSKIFNRCIIDGENCTDHTLDFSGDVDVTNSVFINIPAGKYACVFRTGVNFIQFDNNTIVGTANGNNGLFVQDTHIINNCIFLDLASADSAVGFTFNNCCFFDITNPVNGVQNNSITTDPLLVDVANKNYRLGAGSPCIGAGTTVTISNGIDTATWGNGTTELPIVTNKARTAPFDIGAYIN